MANIFICYSSQDREIANRFAERFRKEGWSIWMDTHMHVGTQWVLEIEQQLSAAQAIVILWSNAAKQSPYVIDEAHDALKQKKTIIPIRLEDMTIPYGFGSRQAVDIWQWNGEDEPNSLHQLLASLHIHLKTRPQNKGQQEEVDFVQAYNEAKEKKGIPPTIQTLLDEINDIKTTPPRRLEIGDKLDNLDDPRKGVGINERGLPDIDWVEVPSGPFIYQDGEPLELPSFHLARYPVTNHQFQAFVAAGGYDENQWWNGLRKPNPENSTWNKGNRPSTDINWYEATAFCRWLSEALGYEIRLPTEQEWEKAARGEEGLIYPWGNEFRSGHANINETREKKGEWYLKQTTAVGLYPQGASPYGLAEMSGNVWEWCRNKYKKPEFIDVDDSGDSRVLRGGSWIFNAGRARAAFRGRSDPGSRSGDIGFRVCSSAPITDR